MTDAWQQLVAKWPFLQTIWDALCVIVPLSCMLALAGLYFISSTARIIGVTRKRSAFEKCSRQLAFLGLVIGWSLLVGGRVWLYYTQPQHQEGTLESYMLEMSWMLLSLGVLLSTVFYFLWRPLKNMPILHVTLGMISATQNCLALICILFTVRICATLATQAEKALALPVLFPDNWEAPIWTAACYTVPLLFALAAGFGACWLALRRKKDDFGRDYYNTMLPWCAAWAKNCWFVLLFLLVAASALRIWTSMQNAFFDIQIAVYETSSLLLWLIPALCWFYVQKCAMPLRNRWLLFIALLIAMGFTLPYFLEITLI